MSLVAAFRANRFGLIPLVLLTAIVVTLASFDPRFLKPSSLRYTAVDAAPLLLLVLGSTLVILTGAIDLSIGAMASLSSVLLATLLPVLGDAAPFVVIALAAAIGAAQGFVQSKGQIPSFVVSLGVLGFCSGLALYLSGAAAQVVDLDSPMLAVLLGSALGIPNPAWVVVVVGGALGLAVRLTGLGRALFAIGSSEVAAVLSGVQATPIKMLVFAVSAGCAAASAILLVAQTGYSSPSLADNLLLPAIVGVVVGGTAISGGVGGLWASALGGLIAICVRIMTIVIGVGPSFQNVLFGAGMIVVVALTTDRRKLGVIK